VAAGLHPNPVPHAEFVTTTTHKTLRGARGGMILCKAEWAKRIDSAVFPGIQGGPLMHAIAGKAVALGEALKPEFKEYQRRILVNAQALADGLTERGWRLVSGGTDNHIVLMDLRGTGITGKAAEAVLDRVGITVNKNTIPFDPEKPMVTSGVRMGTPAVTTRGLNEDDMRQVADLIDKALRSNGSDEELEPLRQRVKAIVDRYPLYPELMKALG